MTNSILVEICCGTLDDCLIAHKNQVDRIELNSALELGGLTPSLATLLAAKVATSIPICCMVRTRTAGFYYSEQSYRVMLHDAEILLKHGADGIVFGFLNPDNTVDATRTKEMADLIHSYNKEVIFHKAFDFCPDLDKASQELISCGVNRVLTGGGLVDILSGAEILNTLNKKYGDKLTYLPGGGVTAINIKKIINISGCRQIHFTAKQFYPDNGEYVAVDDENLKNMLAAI